MEYEPLKIRLQLTGARSGSYGVLASTPTAEAASQFQLPFDERDLENFVLRVGRPRRGIRSLDSPEFDATKVFGSELFDALFQGEVRDLYHAAAAEADNSGKGLRITLLLGQAPALMHVPWEYLCEGGDFLSVSERTPIVRYLDLPRAHKALPVEPPLRIVGMVSAPSDVIELDVDEEKRRLEDALGDLIAHRRVEIVWLERATLRELLRALEESDFHIFHYIGHGAFNKDAHDGVLMLEDDRGRGKPVTGTYLGHLLKDERTLQLAVLNACEGARTDQEDPFGGVAASLVKEEIPSVVAMQFEITDEAAILFADGFYSALARGSPVDAALAAARKAIWADYNDIEWGTPVLFMRVPDGRIFDLDAEDGEPHAPGLDVRLSAEPDVVDASEEVTWQLTITNVGKGSLYRIFALGSDGSTLVDESELRPGRRCEARWRTRPEEDAGTTMTITATDSRGDRIAEQVTAHVTVRSAAGGVETPDRSRATEEKHREGAAAGAQRQHEQEEDRLREQRKERLREEEERGQRAREDRRKRLRIRVAAGVVLASLLAAAALLIGWLTGGDQSPSGKHPASGALDWQREADAELGGPGDQGLTSIVNASAGRLAYLAGGYDASAGNLDAAVWTLEEGGNWQRREDGSFAGPGDQKINSVDAKSWTFLVAVGSDGSNGDLDAALWRSSDGASWEAVPGLRVPDGDEEITRISGQIGGGWRTGDGKDGAVWRFGQDGTPRADAAPIRDAALGGPGDQWINRVRPLESGFVAVGFDDGNAGAWVSPDGQRWNRVHAEALGGDGEQEILDAYNFDSQLVAVGVERVDGENSGVVWRSRDGENWERVPDPKGTFSTSSEIQLNRVVSTEGLSAVPALIAGGSDGEDAAVWTSEDGERWVRELDPSGSFGAMGQAAIQSLVADRLPVLAVGSAGSEDGSDAAVWRGDPLD